MSCQSPENPPSGHAMGGACDIIDDAVLVMTPQGVPKGWNRAAGQLFDLDGPAPSADLAALSGLVPLADGAFVLPLSAPDGERYYRVGVRRAARQGAPDLVVQLHDETEGIRAERALRQSEARFRTLLGIADDAIVMTDTQGRIRVWSPAAERIFGWRASEVLGIGLSRLLQPADGEGSLLALCQGDGTQPCGVRPLPAWRKDGSRLLVELSFSRAPLSSGWGALAILRDVTARVQAEDRLRRAEERWQFALEGGGDGVWDWNIATGQVYYSPRLARMLGFEVEEFGSDLASFRDRVHPDDLARVDARLTAHFAGESDAYVCEFRMRHRDGGYRWIHSRGKLMAWDGEGSPQRMVGTHRDISDARAADEMLRDQLAETRRLNRRLEEAQSQLIQSEKMASVGQLSAGIAHELNTPLGFVGSNLGSLERYFLDLMELVAAYEYAEKAFGPEERRFAAAREARRQCELDYMKEDMPALFTETRQGLERVQRIMRDLNDFAQVGGDEYRFSDLNRNLEATLKVLAGRMAPGIAVRQDWDARLGELWCQPSALNQAFLNILDNAIQAMAGGGTLSVATRRAGAEALVEVADTGCGIPPEAMGRIFEPFFTTKPVGQGTGLGLSLAYGIVRKHGGRIEADSQPGQGSTFRIYLPLGRGAGNEAGA